MKLSHWLKYKLHPFFTPSAQSSFKLRRGRPALRQRQFFFCNYYVVKIEKMDRQFNYAALQGLAERNPEVRQLLQDLIMTGGN